MLTADERVERLLRIMEDSLADEVVEEVASLSRAELTDAALAHGCKPSARAPAVLQGGRVPESVKPASQSRDASVYTSQTDHRHGLTSVATDTEHSKEYSSPDVWEKPRAKRVASRAVAGASADEGLEWVLATLEECRDYLQAQSGRESVELLSVVILDIRMRLRTVDSVDLKALCDEMLRGSGSPEVRQDKMPTTRSLLRVVK